MKVRIKLNIAYSQAYVDNHHVIALDYSKFAEKYWPCFSNAEK